MKTQYPSPKKVLFNQSGQGLMEYLILVMLIGVVSIAATKTLGKAIKTKIQAAKVEINGLSSK